MQKKMNVFYLLFFIFGMQGATIKGSNGYKKRLCDLVNSSFKPVSPESCSEWDPNIPTLKPGEDWFLATTLYKQGVIKIDPYAHIDFWKESDEITLKYVYENGDDIKQIHILNSRNCQTLLYELPLVRDYIAKNKTNDTFVGRIYTVDPVTGDTCWHTNLCLGVVNEIDNCAFNAKLRFEELRYAKYRSKSDDSAVQRQQYMLSSRHTPVQNYNRRPSRNDNYSHYKKPPKFFEQHRFNPYNR